MIPQIRTAIMSGARQMGLNMGLSTAPRMDEDGNPLPSEVEEFAEGVHNMVLAIVEDRDEVRGYMLASQKAGERQVAAEQALADEQARAAAEKEELQSEIRAGQREIKERDERIAYLEQEASLVSVNDVVEEDTLTRVNDEAVSEDG